jgi:hypothetical protein
MTFDMTWSKVPTVAMALFSVYFLARNINVAAIICGGVFLMGLGDWINKPTAAVPWKANWLGILLEGAGCVLGLYGTYLVFWPS